MRTAITRNTMLLLAVLVFSGASVPAQSPADGPIEHIVLCWLKDPNEANRNRVIETSRELAAIPGVTDLRAGAALRSDRDIVDDSFDVGISMSFDTRRDMERYLDHEEHVRRVREVLLPLCGRVRIHDFTY